MLRLFDSEETLLPYCYVNSYFPFLFVLSTPENFTELTFQTRNHQLIPVQCIECMYVEIVKIEQKINSHAIVFGYSQNLVTSCHLSYVLNSKKSSAKHHLTQV